MQPEVWLKEADPERINSLMTSYLDNGILYEAVHDGFILCERTTENGVRLGLMAALDLEEYDFTTGTLLTRATEDTVPDRLPPRVKIRINAPLELPHVMVLIDDPDKTVIEPLYEKRAEKRLLYDVELMKNGGHLRGFAVEDADSLERIGEAVNALKEKSGGFLYAVGDGNHSLATAKKCWEEIKKTLSEEEAADHPARYALCEIENLHQESLKFEPIHRVIFNARKEELVSSFREYLVKKGMDLISGEEAVFTGNGDETGFSIKDRGNILPVKLVQDFLDGYLKENAGAGIDYIHGSDTVYRLSSGTDNTGILLKAIDKQSFFDGIRAGGHLPRKTFSMGEANEKRYYMEVRKLR